jgi:D-lactate dehydrogenase
LAAAARDASHYLIAPRARLVAQSIAEVQAAFKGAAAAGVPVTLRSGGTSLSGQASGPGVLVDVRQAFAHVEVHDSGRSVTAGGGATLRFVNARLARHSRVLGPDPASEVACTIGGVVANNSSGMACGTEFNTYRTLTSMVVLLPSGTVVDTAHAWADERLRAQEGDLYRALAALRERVLANPRSLETIRQQYSMKNTMGYGVNSLVDFATPIEILQHLMIGSEGTLGFVAEATFATLPLLPAQATALLVFPNTAAAAAAVEPLTAAGAKTIELEDAASIRAAAAAAPPGDPIHAIRRGGATALLVDARAETEEELADQLAALRATLPRIDLLEDYEDGAAPRPLGAARLNDFTRDEAMRAALWSARKGLYTAVAGARRPGTTALLEDVAVPARALPHVCDELQRLFADYRYADGVIFGHAKDGNVHFMISLELGGKTELSRYEAFTEEMVDLVLGAGGTLKAEHGTGRVMAPFVRRQFGDELYQVMRQIKTAFDPTGLLGPGVILTDDPRSHMLHIKPTPKALPAIDRCVECGYCEPTCPARDLTTTPRGRIGLLRTIALAPRDQRASLIRSFDYTGADTCAADSLCAVACPVGIDTGKVVKAWRAARLGPTAQHLGTLAARHWGAVVAALRLALRVAAKLPPAWLAALTRAARRVLPQEWIPQAGADLPGPGPRRRPGRLIPAPDADRPGASRTSASQPAAVCFPACVNSLFGPAQPGSAGISQAFATLADRAGVELRAPLGIGGLCCGTVWQSKGLTAGRRAMAARVVDALWEATDGGRLPVVADAASCALGLREAGEALSGRRAERLARLRIEDACSFAWRVLAPRLAVTAPLEAIAVHPTCSTTHLGSKADLIALAAMCAREVFTPDQWGCCAFAGDRGMLHPELTAAATAPEARAIWAEEARRGGGPPKPFDAYVSCNRTCEIGLSRATGRVYRHVLEILAEISAAAPPSQGPKQPAEPPDRLL